MDNLEPITRNEMFLNGDDLEPITREEMILAGADLEPLTRHEWFLKKYRGSGDVTIKRLAVTENGTYSESGKAYSPVVVNVPAPPLPENAYLLNDLSDLPADIASFTDGTDLPMASLKVSVTPYQDLSHGDPSPENICPIIGWDECNVSVSPNRLVGANWKDGYFINASGQEQSNYLYKYTTTMINVKPSTTYYVQMNYQSVDELAISVPYYNNNGEFISRDIVTQFSTKGIHGGQFTTPNNCYGIRVSLPTNSKEWNLQEGTSIVADNTYTIDLNGTRYGGTLDATDGTFLDMIDHIASYNGEELPPAWISDRDVYAEGTTPTIGAEVVYTRATPITVQLAPQPVKSLEGVNKIFANCGQITEGKYFKRA